MSAILTHVDPLNGRHFETLFRRAQCLSLTCPRSFRRSVRDGSDMLSEIGPISVSEMLRFSQWISTLRQIIGEMSLSQI
jgi:hypothetical protein